MCPLTVSMYVCMQQDNECRHMYVRKYTMCVLCVRVHVYVREYVHIHLCASRTRTRVKINLQGFPSLVPRPSAVK